MINQRKMCKRCLVYLLINVLLINIEKLGVIWEMQGRKLNAVPHLFRNMVNIRVIRIIVYYKNRLSYILVF